MQYKFKYDDFNPYNSDGIAKKDGKSLSTPELIEDVTRTVVPAYDEYIRQTVRDTIRNLPASEQGKPIEISVTIGHQTDEVGSDDSAG